MPGSVRGILEGGNAMLAKAAAAADSASEVLEAAAVVLAAPIPNPGKILCIGLNYADHAAESGQPLPEYPIVFSKYSNTVIGSGAAIILPKVTDMVDYEAELGFVIGKRGRHISEADALDYVAGYMPINDVSARDYQERVSQWTMGKSFDTFAPMGPALVTVGRGRRPAQARHSPLDRRRSAARLQHQPVDLQRSQAGGRYQRGHDAGAGRYRFDRHATRRRRRP